MKVYRWEDPEGYGPWSSKNYMPAFLADWYMQADPIQLDDIHDGPNAMPLFERQLEYAHFVGQCTAKYGLFAFKSLLQEHTYISTEWAELFQMAGLALWVYEVQEGGYIEDDIQIVFDVYKARKVRSITR